MSSFGKLEGDDEGKRMKTKKLRSFTNDGDADVGDPEAVERKTRTSTTATTAMATRGDRTSSSFECRLLSFLRFLLKGKQEKTE